MKSKFSKYLSKEEWLIREKGWKPEGLSTKETLFTLGNGYLGSRGIYEEIPDGTEPGTYIAGVYDKASAMVSELVNAPNPLDFRINVEGEKLDMGRMDIVENERVLDLKKGILARRTVFSDTRKRKFLYESLRFFSLYDTHIGCMRIYFKSLDKSARIIVQDTVDDSVTNVGSILEGRKRHTQLVDVSAVRDMNYIGVKTFTKKIWISYAIHLAVARDTGESAGTLNRIFNMTVKKGETVCFTKIFSVFTSRHISHTKLKKRALSETHRAKNAGFEKLLENHASAWQKRWDDADVRIKGDATAQKAMRFNIYHLMISGAEEDDNVSIGAKTLSGDGYRGHVFWDTEIFILPFFIYTNPKIARNLLMYRFHRLDEARKIARSKGYRGALFPWESADTGDEQTPPYAKNLDGTIIEIHTGDMEHHIVSDIAYAIWQYFTVTGDVGFMYEAGLEIIFETARFWASRAVYNKKIKKYEIKKVIGPDEFHEDVDNSVYTNWMAAWNLKKAKEFYAYFKKRKVPFFERIARKLSLKAGETESWTSLADKMKILKSKNKGIFEEFEGYFKKKDIKLETLNHHFMPALPKGIHLRDFSKTQLVKQADILMLMYLLHGEFSKEEKMRNYIYYVKRTLHKSSLSPSVHAIMASEVGDRIRAYLFFLFSLYADLRDTHGNANSGIHAASLGGTWQAAIMGFSGFRLFENGRVPSFSPRIPGHWKSVAFSLKWRRCTLEVQADNKKINLFVASKKKGFVTIRYFDSPHKITFNQKHVIYKKER